MNTPLWQRLIPKYGNWGGPGWCGGEYCNDPTKTKWHVSWIDDMDKAFYEHDEMYQKHPCSDHWRKMADLILVRKLQRINPKGWYANAYRIGAIWVFNARASW